MGEIMTEMSLDDTTSYVLTEDMIDAAMNEQFSYQDDIESEEFSQGEENMITVINPDDESQSSNESTDSRLKEATQTKDLADNENSDNNNVKPVQCESPSTSVLVIETGLNSKDLSAMNANVDGNSSVDSNYEIITVASSPQDCSTNSANSDEGWHASVTKNTARGEKEVLGEKQSERDQAPILATMLKETPVPAPVDISEVCEVETCSDVSEDESMEQDAVDNELQSVMESNLMAEVGITVSQIQKQVSPNREVSFQAPKISVKSISQISSSDFESMPDTFIDSEELQDYSSQSTSGANKIIKVSKEINEQKSMSLHLNEIAVPNNETFVNKQGEKMRCVYLKTKERTILPRDKILLQAGSSFVDNKTQPTSKNITLPIPGINSSHARKPIVLSTSKVATNSRMTQPNLYQSHKLVPILPNQTLAAKSNLKLVSTFQKVNFDGPKASASVNSPQSFQKLSTVNTDRQKEIYLPDVLLAPEHLKQKPTLLDKDGSKLPNIPKPNVLYESVFQEISSVNGSSPSDAKRYQNAHRLTEMQKPAQSSSSGLKKNLVSYSYRVPTLQKSPHASVSRPVAQDMGTQTQTVYQYNNSGMELIIKSLLFHNLKKPYVPPEPHPGMEKLTYNCPDCSDRFIFEKNLAEHLARKTLVIRYMCKMCGSDIHFYNRCLLFKHLRMHNNSIKDLDFSCIRISELPPELIAKGIISTTFKSSINPVSLQRHERVLKNSKYGQWQATDVAPCRTYKPIVSVDKISNQQISLPTVSSYVKTNTSTSFTPAAIRPSTQAITSTSISNTTFVPVQGASTPTFTAVVTSASVLTPVIASTTSFASIAHPTYGYVVPTTANTSGASTSTAYSPFVQKLQHQLANQLKCATSRPKNSLLINNSHSQNLKPSQSSKLFFVSKVPQPRAHVVRPAQAKEIKSILKVPSTDNKVEEESKSSKVDQANTSSTYPTQAIIIDHRIKQSNKSSEKAKEIIEDDMIIDIDVDKVIDNFEEEIVDVENVWVDSKNDSTRNNSASANSRKSSKSVTSKTYKRNCPECGVSCLNIGKHLNGNGRPSIHPAMGCKTCYLILPTKCALKIHNRIHSQSPPFKCPDCGKDFTAWTEFYAHLKYSCGHLAKCIRFMCISCKEHFPTQDILGNHIKMTHSRDVYKCQFCPVAFYSIEALQKHTPEKHPNEECILQTHHKQCSICTKKVVPLEKFNAHMEHHIKSSNTMVYGYKCPMCTLTYSNKMAFVIHQIKEKAKGVYGPEKKKTSSKSSNQIDRVDDVEEVSSDTYESINLVEADEPTIETTFDESDEVIEKDPLSLDDWEVQKIKKEQEELCIICKKTYIAPNSKSSCCENCVSHVSPPISIDEYTKSLGLSPLKNQEKPCPKSKKRSFSIDEVPYESKRPKSIISMSRNSSTSSENEAGNFSSYRDILNTKRRNRKKQSKQPKSAFEGQIMSSTALAQLICSKCNNFNGSTKEEFLVHIKSHRTEPNSYQCLECGLCFVVLPSLERHLQMYHQVKDVTSYVKNNNACMPQKSSYAEENMDLEENQCPVCGDKFESQLIFEKHFRGHGRAFMSSLTK